jgi:hypothetical protein
VLVPGALDQRTHRLDHEAAVHAPDPGPRSPGRDHDAHERLAVELALHPVDPGHDAVGDSGAATGAIAVVLHRAPAGLVGVRLGRGVVGHRLGEDAPVVEHLRDVADGTCPFGDPQHEVVVLRTLEARPEPADLLDEGAPRDGEVPGVHLRPEAFG